MNVCKYCKTMMSSTEMDECDNKCQNCCEEEHLINDMKCNNTTCVYIGCTCNQRENIVTKLPDMQNSKSEFNIPIKRVGIKNFKLPIFIIQKDNTHQHTVSDIDIFVDLIGENKGINMSRLPIGLQSYIDVPLNSSIINKIAEDIRISAEAKRCQIIYSFPYFIKKKSPVSQLDGVVYYNVKFDLTNTEDSIEFIISVESTGTSLCPCSKEISEHQGAHNQRSKVLVKCNVKYDEDYLWIEDIIEIIESCYSCEVYSILKRPDEKHVTMKAYNNPKFVEDMGRELFHKFNKLSNIYNVDIEVNNEESIHQHDAYCRLTS